MRNFVLKNKMAEGKNSPAFACLPEFREIETTFTLPTFLVAVSETLFQSTKIRLDPMNVWCHFTPDQANRMLPLVRVIVRDIQEKGAELRSLGSEGRGPCPRFQKKMSQIAAFIEELEELGCFYRDSGYHMGLVVFPALINGQEVYLCWQSDEEAVAHYHRLDEGFAARRRIPPNWYSTGRFPAALEA